MHLSSQQEHGESLQEDIVWQIPAWADNLSLGKTLGKSKRHQSEMGPSSEVLDYSLDSLSEKSIGLLLNIPNSGWP